jgi:hypothetical protein
MLANATLPAIPSWENSEMKPMIDLWNEYQEKEGVEAFHRFIEDHPEWFAVTMSLSESETGIRATTDASYMANKHEDLIYEITKLGGSKGSADQFIQMVVNRDDRPSTFDPAARINQMMTEYGVRNEPYRTSRTPAVAFLSLQEKKGWNDYMNYKEARDIRLEKLGMQQGLGKPASPNMNISKPIVADFKAWILTQKEENPTWWNAYQVGGAENSWQLALQAGKIMLENEEWVADQGENSWANQMKQYIDYREATAYNISRTDPDDEDRIDWLKLDFQQKVHALKLENTSWAYYYDRFFDGDTLK